MQFSCLDVWAIYIMYFNIKEKAALFGKKWRKLKYIYLYAVYEPNHFSNTAVFYCE